MFSVVISGCSLFTSKEDDNANNCNLIITYLPPVPGDLSFEKVRGSVEQVIIPEEQQHVLTVDGNPGSIQTSGTTAVNSLTSRGDIIAVSSEQEILNFDTNQYSLSEVSLENIDAFINRIGLEKIVHISIEGHTDSIGSDRYNQKLSIQRALSVKSYLKKQGVSDQKISTIGFGEREPISPNNNDVGRSKNRRAVIIPFLTY
jgi:outer membrane protein OmpA-like peptidoglycan-associated protein